MPIDIITCRGTGEGYRGATNMLTRVTSQLDPAKFRFLDDLNYPASIGVANQTWSVTGPSEDESITEGLTNLAALIRSTPNKVGIIGYSLGGEVVTRFSEAQARGEYTDCEVVLTACMANPLRREGDSIDAQPFGFGINGQHQPFPDRPHFEAANPGDAITSCPPDSPLRDVADVVSAFGLTQIGGWSEDLVNRMLERRFQPANWGSWLHPIKTWDTYQQAAEDVRGYLSGQHNVVYEEQGYMDRLAAKINAL